MGRGKSEPLAHVEITFELMESLKKAMKRGSRQKQEQNKY